MTPRKKVKLKDVAEAAGVSVGTVSNAINRPDSVSEPTRRKVDAAIRKLDFVPNEGAATLRSGTSRLLGLFIPDVTNPVYAEIARGVGIAAEDQGYSMLLFDTQDDGERELRQLEMLARHRSIGALIVPRQADELRLKRLRDFGLHLVFIDRVASQPDGCSVSVDDFKGGLLAGRHLLSGGRSNIALVNGPGHVPQSAARKEGLKSALAESGRTDVTFFEINLTDTSYADGERAVEELLHREQRPDGIFCINDQLASGVARGLIRAGVDIPGTTSIIGYGDSTIAESAPVPLTTIRQPMFDLGRRAVGMLLQEAIDAESDHNHTAVVYSPELVVRESAP